MGAREECGAERRPAVPRCRTDRCRPRRIQADARAPRIWPPVLPAAQGAAGARRGAAARLRRNDEGSRLSRRGREAQGQSRPAHRRAGIDPRGSGRANAAGHHQAAARRNGAAVNRAVTLPLSQRLHAELIRELVELHHQLGQHRHAVLQAIVPPRLALLAGEPHRLAAGQRLRVAQVADVAIHLGGERRERREARDIDGDDEVPGVAGAFVIGVEVDHVAAERRAVERAREEAEHQR